MTDFHILQEQPKKVQKWVKPFYGMRIRIMITVGGVSMTSRGHMRAFWGVGVFYFLIWELAA